MKNLYRTAELLLSADTDSLVELASIAGYDPKVMYLNADLSHADLRGQDISFLVGLNANYKNAILDDDQWAYLQAHDTTRVDPETRNQRSLIAGLRQEIIREYLEATEIFNDDEVSELLKPLREYTHSSLLPDFEVEYLHALVSKVSNSMATFRKLEEQKRLFAAITRARITFRAPLLPTLMELASASFQPENFADAFDVNNCSVDFLLSSFDEMKARASYRFLQLLGRVITERNDLHDRLVAYIINQEPPFDLAKELLSRLTDTTLVRNRIALVNALTVQTKDGSNVRGYADALSGAPTIRTAYLDSAMKYRKEEIALAALRIRSAEDRPISSIELSDIAYHLNGQAARLKYARRAELILTPHQHRIFVIEIEKIAQTRLDSESIKRQWPKYFGRRW